MRIIYILLAGICLCLSTVFVFSGFSIRSDISDAQENLGSPRERATRLNGCSLSGLKPTGAPNTSNPGVQSLIFLKRTTSARHSI